MSPQNNSIATGVAESPYAWARLWTALLAGAIGSVGMWSVVVILPAVQADFGVLRADATLPYTLTMLGFGIGGIAMGRLADRYGIVFPMLIGTASLSAGYLLSGIAPTLLLFALTHLLIGIGASVTFAPMMADLSHWFTKRRGIAVAMAASGNYVAGAIWPPIVQYSTATYGWRPTQLWIGVFVLLAILPLIFVFRRRIALSEVATANAAAAGARNALGLSSNALMIILSVAAIACCVAMSMPQVHIVAYCGDLGYGAARGAEMLALMLAFGIISRVASGFVADKIGGVATLLIGSFLQGVALFLYLFFDGLTSLYAISILFGLFQGGIVPMYAVIVREYFPPQEAGVRVGIVIFSSIIGMAFGGWVSGAIFDYTGNYYAAFANGLIWNFLNVAIVVWLLLASRPKKQGASAQAPLAA
ncbi:MAG: MFS transporter [Xanthobacteraceae bacterium]|nr:MFS transporter [Xanthobacteraceae bacterium]